MEIESSSERSLNIYQTKQRHIEKDSNPHSGRRENLNSQTLIGRRLKKKYYV